MLFPPLTDFYDLERLEVLRGPQGTLFGRNSTAGAVNLITRRPLLEGPRGYIEFDRGNYDLGRIRAAGEVTIADNFGLRIAGMKLDRDGYIENLADGQVPEVDDDLDGRDVYSFRVTPRWDVTERTSLWAMYEHTREDDDRVRISNQICQATTLPIVGCDPDAFGLDPVNQASTGFAIIAAFSDMIPLGASDAATGLNFDVPRPKVGIREQHTDLEPVFEIDADQWIFGIDHTFDSADLTVLSGYRDRLVSSLQDRHMDVGFTLNPTTSNPGGLWPTSRAPAPGRPFAPPCPALEGLLGVHGGCVIATDQTRYFTYDQSTGNEKAWMIEIKLASSDQQKLGWLVGGIYQDSKLEGDFYIPNNVLDAFGVYGLPALGVPSLYPASDGVAETDKLESYAVFGEVYWSLTDRLTLTAGLRYTDDTVTKRGVPFGFTAFDVQGEWLRSELGEWAFGSEPNAAALALTDYYGVTESARNASSFDELLGALQSVPPMWTPGEAKGVLGLPDSYSVDYVTGRLGLDWQLTPQTMLYVFYDRGRKPGGFDSFYFAPTPFGDEIIDAVEVGAKAMLFDGSLLVNVAAFHNAYDGMQYQQSSFRTENIDADIWGVEIESRWRPTMNVDIEFSYGHLNTEVKDFADFDYLDPAGGDPNWIALKNFDLGGVGRNFVALREDVLAITPQAIAGSGAFTAPGAMYSDGIPVYFSRSYLEGSGITTREGIPVDLDGNHLPNAPEHQISLGVAYTWFLGIGALTARWDYYWQDKMYARAFNRRGDEIDSWSQHNASLALASANGRWTVKVWIRNIEDEDNVTGQYVEEPISGAFRNYFLTEPRVYGATLRFDLAAD